MSKKEKKKKYSIIKEYYLQKGKTQDPGGPQKEKSIRKNKEKFCLNKEEKEMIIKERRRDFL